MLRNKVGDELFQKIIRAYYQKFAGINASTEDFIATAAMVSNKDLRSFLKQWLYKPGLPVLATTWKATASGKKIVVTVEQKQEGLFSFPVELLIKTAGGDLIKTVSIKERISVINLTVRSRVTEIQTDPNFKLLYQAYEIKKE
jgi:aminopeptidase N